MRVRLVWIALILLAAFHLADCAVLRLFSAPPHAERFPDADAWADAAVWLAHPGEHPIFPRPPRSDRLPDYPAWRAACDWVAQPQNIPPDAVFLTPRMSQTFRWYAHRAEVATWKEIPQDAASIVEWWRRILDMHSTGNEWPEERWYHSLADLGPQRLRELGASTGPITPSWNCPKRPWCCPSSIGTAPMSFTASNDQCSMFNA